jgi:hypothetical protein
MKQVITLIAGVAALGILATGCASTNVSKIAAPGSAVCKTVVATPDVEQGGKITGTAEVYKIFGGLIVVGDTKYADGVRFTSNVGKQETGAVAALAGLFGGESNDRAKAAAAYKACEGNNADMILFPSYEIDQNNYFIFSKTTCKVDGFKAVIKGIKSLEVKDYLDNSK